MDNGTQLVSLEGIKFTPQGLGNELRYKLDVKVVVLCPKAHEEQGRVLRRIGLIRQVASRCFDVITLNRLLLGRNSRRGLSGEGIDVESSANLQRILALSHEIFSVWYRLYIDNIHLLNMAPLKWMKSDPPLVVGDVILFIVTENPSGSKNDGVWRLGKVLSATDRKVKIERIKAKKYLVLKKLSLLTVQMML